MIFQPHAPGLTLRPSTAREADFQQRAGSILDRLAGIIQKPRRAGDDGSALTCPSPSRAIIDARPLWAGAQCFQAEAVNVMANLKRSEMRLIDEVFAMGSGYVLDYSNLTFSEFFEDEFGINIYQDKYETRGSSKANHLRAFIEAEDGFLVAKVLRRLWQVREETYVPVDPARVLPEMARTRFFDLVGRIELGVSPPVLGTLSGAAEILNFDTVSRDLERALASAQHVPEDVVTAACSTVESVCRSILMEVGESLPDKKDIKALFGAVRKPLGLGSDRLDLTP